VFLQKHASQVEKVLAHRNGLADGVAHLLKVRRDLKKPITCRRCKLQLFVPKEGEFINLTGAAK
jgi:hypothetical protein